MGTFILVFLFTCSVYLKSSAKLFNPCALGEDGEEMVCKFCTVNQKFSEALKKSLTLRYPPPSACTQAAGQSKQSGLCSCVLPAADPCISPSCCTLQEGEVPGDRAGTVTCVTATRERSRKALKELGRVPTAKNTSCLFSTFSLL